MNDIVVVSRYEIFLVDVTGLTGRVNEREMCRYLLCSRNLLLLLHIHIKIVNRISTALLCPSTRFSNVAWQMLRTGTPNLRILRPQGATPPEGGLRFGFGMGFAVLTARKAYHDRS